VKRAAAFGAFVGLSLTTGARAETLEDAWRLALERDHGLAAVHADLEQARYGERAATAERRPSIAATAGFTQFATAPSLEIVTPGFALSAPVFPNDGYASGTVQVTLPIYTGGRVSAGIDAAHQVAVGAEETEREARGSLRYAVALAYIDVLRAQRWLATAQSSVASLSAHAADVASMVERELVPGSDLLSARVALANAEQGRVGAQNGVALAHAAYNRYLGEPLDRTPALSDDLPADLALAATPVEELVARAVSARGELAAVSARAEGLASQAAAERAARRPQIALVGGYNYIENAVLDRNQFGSVGVGVTWHLYDGGQARSRSSAMQSAEVGLNERAADLRGVIELEVRSAWLSVQSARARREASARAVEEADENVRMSRELYDAGLGTNTNVLDAVALQVAATGNRDAAVLDEAAARLDLERAVGSL
jgi:outer membrane protein TolC